jgi:uracil-DNA glycosylase
MDRGGYGGADDEDFPDTQASFRRRIEQPRNPHMGGVALILKHLLDEQDSGKLSSQCALTNAVKCVQHTNSMSTKATRTMVKECAHHLLAEIRELNPDVLITQGGHPRRTVLKSLEGLKLIREFAGDRRGRTRVFVNPAMVVLTTPHPARQPGLKWKRGLLPNFFLNAIAVAKREAVQRLARRQRPQLT